MENRLRNKSFGEVKLVTLSKVFDTLKLNRYGFLDTFETIKTSFKC